MARRDISGAVDFNHLETYAAGDQALITEVLAIFREQTAIWLRLLEPSGDAQGWRDGAHALKGASLGVGAFRLAEVCGEAEALPSDDENEGWTVRMAILERIRNALNAALADIAAYAHEQMLQSLKTPK